MDILFGLGKKGVVVCWNDGENVDNVDMKINKVLMLI